MNRDSILRRFDEEMRRHPSVGPGYRVDTEGSLVRIVGPTDACIVYAAPDPTQSARWVASQSRWFPAGLTELEWKVYAHDPPVNLPAALADAGFLPNPVETLMVLPLADHGFDRALPDGVEVQRVVDRRGFDDAEAVDVAAFGREDGPLRRIVLPRLGDPAMGLFVACLDGRPVASGRVEMEPGKAFAGLWGGGTVPTARHRGIYRALVAARGELARARGFEYLYVEALQDTSRPILERLGFVPLSDVTGWVLYRSGVAAPGGTSAKRG